MAAVLAGALLPAARAGAQEMPGRIEASVGLVRTGGLSLGSAAATETASAGGRYTLFDTSTSLGASAGPEARIGVRLTRVFQVEASASYATPSLATAVTNDAEKGASVTATEPLKQFVIEGGIMAQLPRLHVGTRLVPFVTAGAGYLRQLHEGQTLIQTGHTYYAGGGARIALHSSDTALLKVVGARVDVRALVRSGGVAFDGRARTAAAVSLSAFFRF